MTRTLTALALVALFGLGAWFRASSIETMPFPNGDEAWHGIQASKMSRGEPFALRTPTSNPMNPFLTPLEVPLMWFCKPTWGVLRAPAVIFGLLAVALTYVLGARALDRTTALIASGMLAVLPVAILYSRIGFDSCQTPLATLLALYAAFRAHRLGLAAAFAASVLVHPTNMFLLPALLAVYLVRALQGAAGDRARCWRIVVETVAVPTALCVGAGFWIMRRPISQAMCGSFLKEHDWADFATSYGRLLLVMLRIFPNNPSDRAMGIHDAAFWGIALGLLAFGSCRLAERRQWDRLALVGGLIVSAVGFHLVAGKKAFYFTESAGLRYGIFLVVPSCLALACLARSLLVEPADRPSAAIRGLQNAAMLALGFACLYSVKAHWFDNYAGTRESIWTYGAENPDPNRVGAMALMRDIDRTRAARGAGAGPVVVVTQWYWVDNPIQYLTHRRRDIRFLCFAAAEPFPDKADKLRRRLDAGGYAVGENGSPFNALVESLYPAGRLQCFVGNLNVYRLKRPEEMGAPAPPAPAVAAAAAAPRR